MQAQDAPDGSPDPRLVGQFAMRYDYVAKVHRAICVVPANGTFSVSVATLAGRSLPVLEDLPNGVAVTRLQRRRDRESACVWKERGRGVGGVERERTRARWMGGGGQGE